MTFRALASTLTFAATLAAAAGAPADAPPPPKDLDALKARLEQILKDSKTPGMSLALVTRDGPLFIGGLGLAQVEPPVPADADTMFRIGSTSKAFVAIAALRLVREGKLDLQAKVRDLAPEIWFENPWEATDPVRVVHLLEHTTGWDDIHLRDYAHEDPTPNNTKAALDHDPDSRVSRWRPGTRMAYCNAGPVVTAYIIEKIVGAPIEDYVGHEVLPAIGMQRTTYFLSDDVKRTQATLYHADGVTPFAYWHVAMRAAGSVNSSARDMAEYVRFHLNRGRVGPVGAQEEFLTEAELVRMETPETNLGAAVGLKVGYGLHNYTSIDDDGFLWHGHNGGVLGGGSDFSYLPEHGVGYAFQVNAVTEEGFPEIAKLVRRYLTKDLPRPKDALPPEERIPDDVAAEFSGFYLPVNPRVELIAPLEQAFGVAQLKIEDGAASYGDALSGDRKRLVGMPGNPRLLRREDRQVATAALIDADALGAPGLVVNTTTFVKAPAVVAFTPVALVALSVLLALGQALFIPVWGVRALRKRIALRPHLEVRLWPVATSIAYLAFLIGIAGIGFADNLFALYGAVTPASLGVAVASVLAVALPWIGLWRVMRAEHVGVHRGLRGFSLATLGAHAALSACVIAFGMVPFVTWG